MSGYDPAAEAARWHAMAADLVTRSQQAARLAEILRQAAEDPVEIERERARHFARDQAEGGARARVFPWKPPAGWVQIYILNAAATAEREAARLLTSAANFREIGEAVRAG
jgi:phage-related protein